jgi:cytochrome P450
MELWRPMVIDVIHLLLDEAEEKGSMDVMADFATPLPLLVIAQMLGMPNQDRQFIRELAEKLLFIGRGEVDRMKPLTEGIQELQEYLARLCRNASTIRAMISSPCWRVARKLVFTAAMKSWPMPSYSFWPDTRPPLT